MSTLSREKARKVYDRIGSIQDSQAFYEDQATSLLLENGRFGEAEAVFEFGCGTGRFALRLLQDFLSGSAIYRGYDISPGMVRLATAKLEPYADRASVQLSDGGPPTAEPDRAYDRFVSNYVFDLLSRSDIKLVLAEAARMVHRNGLLCLSGLSSGTGFPARIVGGTIGFIHAVSPGMIGGCRPIDLVPFLERSVWKPEFHKKVRAFGITSEALIARRN